METPTPPAKDTSSNTLQLNKQQNPKKSILKQKTIVMSEAQDERLAELCKMKKEDMTMA